MLLLIYSFGNSPAIMFHHHDYKVVAYEKATPCEKTVYYANKEGQCSHKAHITNAVIKCALCDNHNLTAHTAKIPPFTFTKTQVNSEYNNVVTKLVSLTSSQTSNRGPPQV